MKAVAVLVMAGSFLVAPSHATWKAQYANETAEVRTWYENAELTPEAELRFHFHKCCAKSETVKTRFSVDRTSGKDVWSYLLPDGKWKLIPADIVHENEPTPDGQPVLFVISDGRETCFYPGLGGI